MLCQLPLHMTRTNTVLIFLLLLLYIARLQNIAALRASVQIPPSGALPVRGDGLSGCLTIEIVLRGEKTATLHRRGVISHTLVCSCS